MTAAFSSRSPIALAIADHFHKQNSTMERMERRAWTHDELVKVLAIYCQLPFGKMHARNPVVLALASAIERTPSAVALKLVNFASLDPELRARGISGMPNVSQADRDIWQEFHGRWEALADATIVDPIEEMERSTDARSVTELRPSMDSTEDVRQVRVRRGQSFFRAAVLAAHDWKCCITGIATVELLRASHIVPWASNPELRLDPHNGLCLNALHDAAFDRGLITFSEEFEMQLSGRLRHEVPPAIFEEMFEKRCGASIVTPERFVPSQEMIAYHRINVFERN